MTSHSWTRSSSAVRYDDSYAVDNRHPSPSNKYDSYSPTSKRKMISQLERRLADLRENSESMALKLGRAEKTLRVLKIEDEQQTTRHSYDDELSDDSLLYQDVTRHRDNREALRQEIASLREDLRLLRRQTATSGGHYVDESLLDGTVGRHRNHVTRDDYKAYHDDSSRYQRHQTGYDRGQYDDDLPRLRRSKTTFDDVDYSRYRIDAPFVVSSTSCSGTGHRSSIVRPIVTQRNRTIMTSPTSSRRWIDALDTSSMRTFKPYGPRDLSIGDVVKFRRSAGSIERGKVHYIGHLPGKSEVFLGVEMETNTGSHDGLHNGFRYFQCKPNRGLFIPFDNVVVAWGSRLL